jgi:hypothetical protein
MTISIFIPYGYAVLIRIVTLALAALGIIIQRKSHLLNDAQVKHLQKNALKRPLWHVGFWLYVICSVVSDMVGISSLPLLVMALMGSLLLFFNAIFSHIVLHENMTMISWFATILVAVASSVISILMNLPDKVQTPDELRNLVTTPLYIFYCVVNLCAIVVLFICTRIYSRKRKKWLPSCLSPSCQNELQQQQQQQHQQYNRYSFRLAFIYQGLSTVLAAAALVYAKLTFGFLNLSLVTKSNQFASKISISIVSVAALASILQLVFFNMSLHYYTTLFTIPFGYSLGIILACINTLIYYNSFSVLDPWKSVVIIICVLLTIFAVWLLRGVSE